MRSGIPIRSASANFPPGRTWFSVPAPHWTGGWKTESTDPASDNLTVIDEPNENIEESDKVFTLEVADEGDSVIENNKEEIAKAILRKNLVKATTVLVSLLESKDEAVRLQAAIIVIEYVLGKPVQPIRYEMKNNST